MKRTSGKPVTSPVLMALYVLLVVFGLGLLLVAGLEWVPSLIRF
jgi:hypothetical protein